MQILKKTVRCTIFFVTLYICLGAKGFCVPKKYIFTGGPGAGKTSLLNALEARYGIPYIPEASADIKNLMRAEGIEKPWEEPNLNERIYQLLKGRIETFSHVDKPFILLDRSAIDILVYDEPGSEFYPVLFADAQSIANDPSYGKIVFLIENLGHCVRTSYRHETIEEAIRLEKAQIENYKKFGFQIEYIGPGTLEERMEQVMEVLKQDQNVLLEFKDIF